MGLGQGAGAEFSVGPEPIPVEAVDIHGALPIAEMAPVKMAAPHTRGPAQELITGRLQQPLPPTTRSPWCTGTLASTEGASTELWACLLWISSTSSG